MGRLGHLEVRWKPGAARKWGWYDVVWVGFLVVVGIVSCVL